MGAKFCWGTRVPTVFEPARYLKCEPEGFVIHILRTHTTPASHASNPDRCDSSLLLGRFSTDTAPFATPFHIPYNLMLRVHVLGYLFKRLNTEIRGV